MVRRLKSKFAAGRRNSFAAVGASRRARGALVTLSREHRFVDLELAQTEARELSDAIFRC